MRCLVIHAHPDPESYSAALRQATVEGLELGGHQVDVIDLYAIEYRPAMTDQEHRQYYTIAKDHPDPMVAKHIALVKSADMLVFVYPTWWSGLPALMKSWLDRTLLPGVSFIKDDETGKISPALSNVRHLVCVTTSGSPSWWVHLVGDAGRRTIMRTIRLVCHWRCRRHWFCLSSLDSSTQDERTNFLAEVSGYLAKL